MISEAAANILLEGLLLGDVVPRRVVVRADGYAVDARRAELYYFVKPRFVWIRNDGWTLGAPACFKRVAADMWPDEWLIGPVELPATTPLPSLQ